MLNRAACRCAAAPRAPSAAAVRTFASAAAAKPCDFKGVYPIMVTPFNEGAQRGGRSPSNSSVHRGPLHSRCRPPGLSPLRARRGHGPPER